MKCFRFWYLTAILVIMLCACATTQNPNRTQPFKIVNTTLAKQTQVSNNQGIPINPSNAFSTNDKEAIFHVQYAYLTGQHKIKWEWIDPSGNVYSQSEEYALEAPKDVIVETGTLAHKISIKDAKAADLPGEWTAKVYLDDGLVAQQGFDINMLHSFVDVIPNIDFWKYHALIIGNNNYQNLSKLNSATNDAKGVAALLKKDYGFTVDMLLDATRADIVVALDKLRGKLTNKHNLLLYYAGHGWLDEDANEGYWLPVDANRNTKVNWISNANITAALKAMNAKHIIVVVDSCYAGKMTRGLRIDIKPSNYLSKMSRKKCRTVMTSGGLEPVLDTGGNGGHSIFAAELLKRLKENKAVLDATELFSKIRRPVMLNADQTPEYSDIRKAGHEGGDFLFVRKR